MVQNKDKVIYISETEIGSIGAKVIATSLPFCDGVEEIHMRECGIGASVIKSVIMHAIIKGNDYLGVYALEGGSAERLYREFGMTEITRQTEWTKTLL